MTLLLWVVNFMNIMILYSLSNWLPTVVTGMGYSQQTAVLVGTVLQVGGTIGTFGLAWLIARRGFMPVLTADVRAWRRSASRSSASPASRWPRCSWSCSSPGGAWSAASRGSTRFRRTFYPTYLRSTGVGAGLGVGRAGGIVGPYVGGILLAQQWTSQAAVLGRGAAGDRLDDHGRHDGLLVGTRLGRRAGPVPAEEVTLAH